MIVFANLLVMTPSAVLFYWFQLLGCVSIAYKAQTSVCALCGGGDSVTCLFAAV